MNLPFRSLFLALIFVLLPAVVTKLSAKPLTTTHYKGDPTRRPLDGSYRTPKRQVQGTSPLAERPSKSPQIARQHSPASPWQNWLTQFSGSINR